MDILQPALLGSPTDVMTDVLALAVFYVIRKLSFNEIYIEVTDRNPLFNRYLD
jgi:hypothetical protein